MYGEQGHLLADSQGRRITYLRISVTDACNFSCPYCGPERPHTPMPASQIVHLGKIAKTLGLETLRITGGEPLLREDLPSLVASLANLQFRSIGMTTNGSLLADRAPTLAQAGLQGVNVSLDATDPSLFFRLSGGHEAKEVLTGIEKALLAGLEVKLNCVPLLGTYEQQVPQVMTLASSLGIPVRFIELMPIGGGRLCTGVPFATLHSYLAAHYGEPTPIANRGFAGYGPARYFRYGGALVGTIEALSACFCSSCNRLRLTSGGLLRSCLYHEQAIDVRALLESKVTDAEIAEAIRLFVQKKPMRHAFAVQGMASSLASIGG